MSQEFPFPDESHRTCFVNPLHGSAMGYFIAEAAKRHSGLTVVICNDASSHQQLHYQLDFFAKTQTDLARLEFPDWEMLPYDRFSPHQDLTSARLKTLAQLQQIKKGILIVPISALLQRIAPREFIYAYSFFLKTGDALALDQLRKKLIHSGYRHVGEVIEHGEYAIRGSIFDIFPMGSEKPYRIDLFDDTVDSIRSFDPKTQLSEEKINAIELLPAKEFPVDETSIALFRNQFRANFEGNPTEIHLYQAMSEGTPPPGIEHYLPLFFKNTSTLVDYFPDNTLVIQEMDLANHASLFMKQVKNRYDQYAHDRLHPILQPHLLYETVEKTFADLKKFLRFQFQEHEASHLFSSGKPPELFIEGRTDNPLKKLSSFLNTFQGKVLFCAETAGRREILLEWLKRIAIQPKPIESFNDALKSNEQYSLIVAALDQGMILQNPAVAIITESQLFSNVVLQRRRRERSTFQLDRAIYDLGELKAGSLVVHRDHGVGCYQGLQTLTLDGIDQEFMLLQYQGSDKLYVPISSLNLISRYGNENAEKTALNRLGNSQWEQHKKKAQEHIRDTAAELLELYAKRMAKQGFAFAKPDENYFLFSQSFPFEETPDQAQAIETILEDMQKTQPMDRLVCGDVGYGKTEVAMRAAFFAVNQHKQVAVLVPTTLLAQQHYQSFLDRFANWPISIAVLSRFRTQKETDTELKKLAEGKVDIVIGTHKLLQPNVVFNNLGLVIVDEEHRFGVNDKEKLKKLRAEVDMLTLTATPIPRTLNMSLASLRDLSIIATPPLKRLSIKTFLHERSDIIMKEAILRELSRGGQVYFLHNKVQQIPKIQQELQALVPEAKIAVAHGQMHERELERVMVDFYHHRFNILLCSTIIESGIDVPTANTILIDSADHLGLAQLHQLRGRVGRSHHQAYAYLLYNDKKSLTKDAEKRLEAITRIESLGAGFLLANHDLEIRGAGELLGDEQSGHIHELGFSLYMSLLEEAVQALKTGTMPDSEPDNCEIDLTIPAIIPEKYIGDPQTRLMLYKRIAHVKTQEALDGLQIEMIDRFGLLPEPAKNLFEIAAIKLKLKPLGVRKIKLIESGGHIEFIEKPAVHTDKLLALLRSEPDTYKLAGSSRIKIVKKMPAQTRVSFLSHFYAKLI